MHPQNPTRTIGPLLVVLLAIWICACDQSVVPGTQDSGVVDSQHGRYIIVVIGEHPEGESDLVRFIRAVEQTFQKISSGGK